MNIPKVPTWGVLVGQLTALVAICCIAPLTDISPAPFFYFVPEPSFWPVRRAFNFLRDTYSLSAAKTFVALWFLSIPVNLATLALIMRHVVANYVRVSGNLKLAKQLFSALLAVLVLPLAGLYGFFHAEDMLLKNNTFRKTIADVIFIPIVDLGSFQILPRIFLCSALAPWLLLVAILFLAALLQKWGWIGRDRPDQP